MASPKATLLRLLSMRELASFQAKKKLLERGFALEEIDPLLTDFQTKGFIDDQRWLEARMRTLLRKRRGPRDIAMRLKADGAPSELLEEALSQLTAEQQHEAIRHLVATRYAKYDLSDYKEKQKVMASLARRGFTTDAMLLVLSLEE